MGEVESIENLVAAKMFLKSSIEKSRALGSALEKTGPRLEEISKRLQSLEAAVRPIDARKHPLFAVKGQIKWVVEPAAAVLKVFDAVHGLEKSLMSNPSSDLSGYLSVVKRLEEVVKFLANNCGLTIQWLEDIVQRLEENAVGDDDRYLSNLKKSLKILRELQATDECARLDGGLLCKALDKLEVEFMRLLTENSAPLPLETSIAPSQIPGSVIQTLQTIVERFKANNRREKCKSMYVEARSSNARESIQVLGLDYLDRPISELDYVQEIDEYIDLWGKHLEFTVQNLLEPEYKLCNEVFAKLEPEFRTCCFAKIAAQSGFLTFIKFGNNVTNSKNDPIKLLRLLDIFATLNKLRLDFNKLFGTKACIEIQDATRDLIKKVINGACEIFWELSAQVEIEKQTPPPSDGSVPRLVTFVLDYCNQLLGNSYRPTLTQVLVIHQSWKKEKYEDTLLTYELRSIINAIELNLETWSKAYHENTVLSYFIMMNTHWHLHKTMKGTKLGDVMGDFWLKRHEQFKEYYTALFLRESWARLPTILSREGHISFSGGRVACRDNVKKRLNAFSVAFDETYKKQSNWVVPDKSLRDKTCQLVVQTLVPAYRSYMQNYGHFVEQDASGGKYVKYTAQSLENLVTSLFQPRLVNFGSTKNIHKIENVVTNQFRSTLTAA